MVPESVNGFPLETLRRAVPGQRAVFRQKRGVAGPEGPEVHVDIGQILISTKSSTWTSELRTLHCLYFYRLYT